MPFQAFLTGGGEMGDRIRAHDWTATPLGPPDGWPAPLRVSLGLCLQSSFPTAIYWGPELILLYNDAWSSIPGPRHPGALGRPAREVWSDIWDVIAPQLDRVVHDRTGFSAFEQMLPMERGGAPEETYWDYSFTPIVGESGGIAGVFNQGREVTHRVLQSRRDRFLAELDDALRRASGTVAVMDAGLELIGRTLGVGRVGFAEIDGDANAFAIVRCWTDGMADISGLYPLGSFGRGLSERLARGEVVRIDSLDDPLVREDGTAETYARIGISAGMVAPLLSGGDYAAGLFVQTPVPRRWTDHEADLLCLAVQRMWRDIARARAEAALRDSEERHRLIFEQANDIMFTADLDQTITAANPAAGTALGLPPEELVGRHIADFVSAEGYARTSAMLAQKVRDGGTTRYDVDVLGPNGRRMRWQINSTLTTNPDGRPIGLHAIARDVTEERAFEARQQLLIHELNHRVKNTLALVQALALQSLKPGRDPDRAAGDFQSRLSALAAAHDLLTREQWEGATLAELVDGATRPLARERGRIEARGPDVEVTPKAAVSIVMALHELSTNATKYGALSVPTGRVAIEWTVGDGRLRISWREQGGPPVEPPRSRGFGIRMIERALASDLAGQVSILFDPRGLVCTIDAPVDLNLRKEA